MAVCLKHTDCEAVTRCIICHKPLCADCVLRRGRLVFCSGACAEEHAREERIANMPGLHVFNMQNAIYTTILILFLAIVLLISYFVLK